MPTPFVIVGDMIGRPTGLARILTDLATRLHQHQVELDLDVRVCGWVQWANLPLHGTPVHGESSLPCWAFRDSTTWGAPAVSAAYRSWFGNAAGIIFTIWDAHRAWGIMHADDLPVQWWGYVPVDAVNTRGQVGGGPAATALRAFHRVLAYTDFGARAIEQTILRSVPHLPHGLNLDVWALDKRQDAAARSLLTHTFARTQQAKAMLVGTVATNQLRKDWGVTARMLAELRGRGLNVHGWWHVDQPVTESWSLPQLLEDFDLGEAVTITTDLSEAELAMAYSLCAATFANGRGEGFGYPIVESLAMGTPVTHVEYAGGAEFTPRAWRIAPEAYRIEGAYGLSRPVVSPHDVADRLDGILTTVQGGHDREKIAGIVKHLGWETLWPQWRAWIEEGLASR